MWKKYEINPVFDIKSFYSAFTRICPTEYFFHGESHDFWELVFVRKGSACVCADKNIVELVENQLIFHKPMEFHSLRTPGNKHTELFIISFSCEGKFMSCFENRIYDLKGKDVERITEIHELVMSHNNTTGNFHIPTDCLENICKDPTSFKLFKNLVENFLIHLSKTYDTNAGSVKNSETAIYARALQIIDESLHTKLSVDNLAKACNASPSYLKKIFGKYNGLGIHEYILQTKFSEAKRLLEDGKSVTEVSEILGFSSQNYFSTSFKRVMGMSPGKLKSN